MNTKELIDDIVDELNIAQIKKTYDKYDLLAWMSAELNKLSAEMEHDCFYINLSPIVTTVVDQRFYDLPDNFGLNFAPAGGEEGEGYCCSIDDGSSESAMTYMSATRFYSLNLAAESAAKPSFYTIVTKPNGFKQIGFSPLPEDEYDINGLYKPTNWDLKTMEDLPPIPHNCAVLKYAVLNRIDKKRWENDYSNARAICYMELARSRKVRLIPSLRREHY